MSDQPGKHGPFKGPPYTDGDEDLVQAGLMDKVRETMGKVPFTEDAVAAFYAARDPKTPSHAKALLFGALAYFIVPTDMVPDFIAGLGFTDDAAVLIGAYKAIAGHITDAHKAAARAFLGKQTPP